SRYAVCCAVARRQSIWLCLRRPRSRCCASFSSSKRGFRATTPSASPIGKYGSIAVFVDEAVGGRGAVEGIHNKTRVITRRSFEFRTFKAIQMALHHTLGRLPELEPPTEFC